MSLMRSRQPKSYRFEPGDWITADEAGRLLGYKSGKNLRDETRRNRLRAEFEELDCTLTHAEIGGQHRFLRSEIDDFIQAKIEAAQAGQRRRALRLAA